MDFKYAGSRFFKGLFAHCVALPPHAVTKKIRINEAETLSRSERQIGVGLSVGLAILGYLIAASAHHGVIADEAAYLVDRHAVGSSLKLVQVSWRQKDITRFGQMLFGLL